jgi:hypothetical protein
MGMSEKPVNAKSRPGITKPTVTFGEVSEPQFRIDCKGKSAVLVLEDLGRALADAEAKGRDPLIVLEDLGLLADSVTTLIKGLCRLLVGYPRTVSFWESSGYTEAFLSVMDGQTSHEEEPPSHPPPITRM